MPRRTNRFQSLIVMIQAALHGKKAKVEESALVHNYGTEKEIEIDVLITFGLGGTSYRTAVECRDHSRSAGPSWIAELKEKREDCRLDKMIAVHSKGFTSSALTLAKKYGIETLTPKKGKKVNWAKEVLPLNNLAFQIVKCKIPKGLLFSLIGKQPHTFESSTSTIIFPEQSNISVNDFINQVRKIVEKNYRKQFDLTGKPLLPEKQRMIHKTVDLFITFPPGTTLKPTEGDNPIIASATAVAQINIRTKVIDTLEYISLKDNMRATHADFELMGHKASITLTEQEGKTNELGLCIYWEGGTISGTRERVEEIEKKPDSEKEIRIHLKERK